MEVFGSIFSEGVNEVTAYQEIIKILDHLPFEVLKDIERRTGDWLWHGGNEDDPYIHQQLRYAQNWVRRMTV